MLRMLLVTCLVLTSIAVTAPALASAAGGGEYDGSTYSVFVCKAARDQGYRPPLNNAFQKLGADWDPVRRGQITLQDSCDNWKTGSYGALDAWHNPFSGPVMSPGPSPADRTGWFARVGDGTPGRRGADVGLTITQVQQTYRINGYYKFGGPTPNIPDSADESVSNNAFDMIRSNGEPPGLIAPGQTVYVACRNIDGVKATPISPGIFDGDVVGKAPYGPPSCPRSGTDEVFRFDSRYGPDTLGMALSCGTKTAASYCWYDGNSWSIALSSAILQVTDATDPVATISSIPPGDGDPLDRNGVPQNTKEAFTINATDNSGIRKLEFYIDGQLEQTRDFNAYCNHTYMAPCPGATGAQGPPATPTSNDLTPIRFDVDTLTDGVTHFATLTATDGAGRRGSSVAPVVVTTKESTQNPCPTTGSLSFRDLTAAPGLPKLCNPDRTATLEEDARPDSADGALVSGGSTPDPTPGLGIFQYDLASNGSPGKQPIDPSDCKTLHKIVKGSGAGDALSNVEMDQVVSVTINLEGLVQGQELGQQKIQTSFALPARSTPQYRAALGCPA